MSGYRLLKPDTGIELLHTKEINTLALYKYFKTNQAPRAGIDLPP